MPLVTFTDTLQRHVACPPQQVEAATLREALDRVFAKHPRARSYVLDERGAVRKHMVIFIGGRQAKDRDGLTDPVEQGSEIYVMQALSGG
jgi:hypothetical protein